MAEKILYFFKQFRLSPKKSKIDAILKAARRSDSVSLFVHGRGSERWRDANLGALEALENLSVCRIDDAFVAALVEELDRTIRWSLTVSEGEVFLQVGDRSLHSVPEIWQGSPLR